MREPAVQQCGVRMWRELIRELTCDEQPTGDLHPGPDFFSGATPDELATVERTLGVRLPESLTELLRESNGILVMFGQHLVWSTDEIMRTNLAMRADPRYQESYMPFDHLLFFGDAGVDGIRFAFAISGGRIDQDRVYAWYAIDDARILKALSLRAYVEGWLSGKLTV
jgi:SMI1-KNR4 cell-wall